MTAHQAVCHMADQLRVALGDVKCARHDTPVTRTLAKWLIIYLPIPVPRGRVQTAPEMQSTAPGNWEADVHACEELVLRLGRESTNAVHPAFGELSHREWAILGHKHLDHHLTQFGE